jgi:integrase
VPLILFAPIYFDRVRFDELAEDFLTDYRINNKKSLARAKRSVTHLKKQFEGMRVPDITSSEIRKYISNRMKWKCLSCWERFIFKDDEQCPECSTDDLKSGAANATINREMSALKRMLNLGVQQTPPKVDRVPFIPTLRENNARKVFFEHGDFIKLRKALPDHLKGIASFGYKKGWRISEVTKLTWRQIDLENGIVRLEVGETKNDEARTVYLDDELKSVFQDLRDNRLKNGPALPYDFP